jgi:hypothetical protein
MLKKCWSVTAVSITMYDIVWHCMWPCICREHGLAILYQKTYPLTYNLLFLFLREGRLKAAYHSLGLFLPKPLSAPLNLANRNQCLEAFQEKLVYCIIVCSAVQCSAVQCSAVHLSAVQWRPMYLCPDSGRRVGRSGQEQGGTTGRSVPWPWPWPWPMVNGHWPWPWPWPWPIPIHRSQDGSVPA